MNKEFLNDLSSSHKEWIKIVRGFGETFYAEDIVQEMYIKLIQLENCEKFYQNGKIYKGYIWIILRNMFVDYQKAKQRLVKVNITEAIELKFQYTHEEKINAQIRIQELITQTVKTWHWYDQMLFTLYRDSGLSYRQISAVTGISFKSIYSTVTNCKKSLRNDVKEEYEDYINQDYELIK